MTRRPSARARAGQWAFLAGVVATGLLLWTMAAANLGRRHTGFGFDFLGETANFDIPFRLIRWTVGDTYARALLLCVLNTLLVSAMAIVTATLLGLLIGIMRLSSNWLIRNIALAYVELIRNTPQLVQIVFWYIAVLQTLPGPRQSLAAAGFLLNIRGLYLPAIDFGPYGGALLALAVLLTVATPFAWSRMVRDRPVGMKALLLPVVGLAVLAFGVERIEWPELRGFNIAGGIQIPPELAALWAGLSIYGAAFIAEIVRSSIVAVHAGQREAALSLGLRPGQVLSHVIVPQALRTMVPPMTSQWLNLIKSSSLGAAIAYPELFQIFAGTVLNQTGREIETMLLLMTVFLSISLLTSAFMNWYNGHVALVER